MMFERSSMLWEPRLTIIAPFLCLPSAVLPPFHNQPLPEKTPQECQTVSFLHGYKINAF